MARLLATVEGEGGGDWSTKVVKMNSGCSGKALHEKYKKLQNPGEAASSAAGRRGDIAASSSRSPRPKNKQKQAHVAPGARSAGEVTQLAALVDEEGASEREANKQRRKDAVTAKATEAVDAAKAAKDSAAASAAANATLQATGGRDVEQVLGTRTFAGVKEGYVQWKGMSCLHCAWVSEAHLNAMRYGRKVQKRIELDAQNQIAPWGHVAEAFRERRPVGFDSSLLEIERVLGCQRDFGAGNGSMVQPQNRTEAEQELPGAKPCMYSVKWRGSGYMQSTWEYGEKIRDDYGHKLDEFWVSKDLYSDCNPFLQSTPAQRWAFAKAAMGPFVQLKGADLAPTGEGQGNINELRSYQVLGVNWLRNRWYQKRSCILGDEMGLGKTIQTACFLDWCRTTLANSVAPLAHRPMFLVVVPLSTLANWQQELSRWTKLNVVTYHGTKDDRIMIREKEFRRSPAHGSAYWPLFDCLLTSTQTIGKDLTFFNKFAYDVVVVDEAHSLKNTQSKSFSNFKTLNAHHRLLLTGTPVQNSSSELFALFNILDTNESAFQTFENFEALYGKLDERDKVEKLHVKLQEYLLRRCKEDVETTIPKKKETMIEVELTTSQKSYYRALLDRNVTFLRAKPTNRSGAKAAPPRLMNIAMQLRKVCNHPFLIEGAREKLAPTTVDTTLTLEQRRAAELDALVKHSGKFVLLDKLLPKLRADKHKVLIFSQFVIVLDLIQDFLYYRK